MPLPATLRASMLVVIDCLTQGTTLRFRHLSEDYQRTITQARADAQQNLAQSGELWQPKFTPYH